MAEGQVSKKNAGMARSIEKWSVIFEPGESSIHDNYIEIVLPHALAEGRRL